MSKTWANARAKAGAGAWVGDEVGEASRESKWEQEAVVSVKIKTLPDPQQASNTYMLRYDS